MSAAELETDLSLLEEQHEEVRALAETLEPWVEAAREGFMRRLDAFIMTATGALHAGALRPDLVQSAMVDAAHLQDFSNQAAASALGPLGKTCAQTMERAASTAWTVTQDMILLPAAPPAAPGAPASPSARPSPHRDPGPLAELDPDAAPEAPPARRSLAPALAVLGVLLGVAVFGGRR